MKRLNAPAPDRPVGMAIRTASGEPYTTYPEYDLSARPDLSITGYHSLTDD